uniref:Uncharacterized protein n=1 Tax=Anopheles melas TaxID=34690 RepID=A0A182TE45_9DIPT
MRSVAYSFRILCSNDSYSCCASGPCMARLKSGRLPFNRWYSVNWLTHSISSCRSTTDSDHRLPLEGFSNSRKLSNFRALERDDTTPGCVLRHEFTSCSTSRAELPWLVGVIFDSVAGNWVPLRKPWRAW